MKRLLAPLAALGLLAGCATETSPIASFTDMSGLRTDLLSDNMLEVPGQQQPREVFWLNASRVFHTYDKATYYLEATYMAREETGYLDIPFGQTLTVVLDGKPVKFTGSGSVNLRKKPKHGLIKETALYEVTKEQLQQIATSKKVEVQVRGNNGLILREFNPENYEKFRLFVVTYAG